MSESAWKTKDLESICERSLMGHDKEVLVFVILIMGELVRLRRGYMGILSLGSDGFSSVNYRESAFLADMAHDALLQIRSKEDV